MTGRKTLREIRAELEAAVGTGPPGGGDVAESLRRFLASKPGDRETPNQPLQPTGGPLPRHRPKSRRRGRAAGG